MMKKSSAYSVFMIVLFVSCANMGDSLLYYNQDIKIPKMKTVLYFNPEVFPEIPEIKEPTYSAFHSAASDEMKSLGNFKYLHIDIPVFFDEVDTVAIKDLCKNNNAEVAIVPKVKYFKVGLGKYVFSNQVIVSLKLYDADGNFVMETAYDTYKGNGRLLGSAENSVIIGTKGALQKMNKELRSKKVVLKKAS